MQEQSVGQLLDSLLARIVALEAERDGLLAEVNGLRGLLHRLDNDPIFDKIIAERDALTSRCNKLAESLRRIRRDADCELLFAAMDPPAREGSAS